MESIEIAQGRFRFSALADGPTDGPLVLLLHGFPETSFEWRAQLSALAAAGYRAVAPDQRGYAVGARPVGVESYHIKHLVDDALGFADVLGAPRFHLVGHDWGGFVAWYVAGRASERLRSLTVVSTPHPMPFVRAILAGGDQAERSGYMKLFRTTEAEATFLADDAAMLRGVYAHHSPQAGAEYVRVFSTDDGAGFTGGLNWYRANDLTLDPGPITAPTMYVWSTGDVALGREAAEGTGAEVTGPYRFEVLDDVSHWIPEDAPDVLNALLLDHLRER